MNSHGLMKLAYELNRGPKSWVSAIEQLAAHETNPKLKSAFEKQAVAYRRLAAKRAADLGLKAARSAFTYYRIDACSRGAEGQ